MTADEGVVNPQTSRAGRARIVGECMRWRGACNAGKLAARCRTSPAVGVGATPEPVESGDHEHVLVQLVVIARDPLDARKGSQEHLRLWIG